MKSRTDGGPHPSDSAIDADFSPKAFLQARRPEQFSDTRTSDRKDVDRSLLEYHLDSITSRNQESQFQTFAKRICERTVCPNLLPQTGPTGGGDSKVDAETYPVAEELSLAWFVGVSSGAHEERWAFAVSAKKAWKPKFQADVGKAVASDRGYKKIFFVTNQAVPDRERAGQEDALRKRHGVDVRILDRSWILDRIFLDKLTDIAIEELRVTALSREEATKGPKDVKRRERLDELERQLTDSIASGESGAHLAELAIDASEIARALELPRPEVMGRLQRAEKLALQYGTTRQRVESSYQTAWTLFWWYEDRDGFIEQYLVVEALARPSANAYDLERLTNLWQLLNTCTARNLVAPDSLDFPQRTATLTASLEHLASDEQRPSAALQAEALLCQVRLATALREQRPTGPVFSQLRDVVLRSRGLVGFPLDPLVKIVTELGSIVRSDAEFEKLFETIVEMAATAEGEIRGAQLLVTRGSQLLSQERPAEAIVLLGRAVGDLFKHESRHDLVRALYVCACAYADVGLLWAARGTLLTGASIATNDFWRYGDVTPYQTACCRRLKWVELQLGRIPQAMMWHEVDDVLREQLAARGRVRREPSEDAQFEVLLARLLLRADLADLPELGRLPDALDGLGLELSADALLFALGYEERLDETARAIKRDDARSLALLWRNIQVDALSAGLPDFGLRRETTLVTAIMGTRIEVSCENEEFCLEIAEAILATLESFLATALGRALGFEPQVSVDVRFADFASDPLEASTSIRNGRPHVHVRCSPTASTGTPEEVQALRKATFAAATTLLSTFVSFRNPLEDIETLFRDERAGDRASAIASGLGAQENVLGRARKGSIEAWSEKEHTSYPLRRSAHWDQGEPESSGSEVGSGPEEEAVNPPDGATMLNASHASLATWSPIRLPLWNDAGWHGVAYALDREEENPPTMAFVFSDPKAPLEIFRLWVDEQSRGELSLGISLIRGVEKAKPHSYSVMVGSDPGAKLPTSQFVTLVNRVCRMVPDNSLNLERFVESFTKHGRYFVAPAYRRSGAPNNEAPAFQLGLSVELSVLRVIDAWQIGAHEFERAAIRDDWDPIIPNGVTDAPILETLRQMTKSAKK